MSSLTLLHGLFKDFFFDWIVQTEPWRLYLRVIMEGYFRWRNYNRMGWIYLFFNQGLRDHLYVFHFIYLFIHYSNPIYGIYLHTILFGFYLFQFFLFPFLLFLRFFLLTLCWWFYYHSIFLLWFNSLYFLLQLIILILFLIHH